MMWNKMIAWLTNPSGFSPHGYCLLWDPALIWTDAMSDIGIGVAYFTIPLALAVFVRRRRDLAFRPIFWLFAAFILLCGLTHWLDVLTLWVPSYGLEALVKVLTAAVSLITAIALWTQMPQALALPSPAQLREANEALRDSQDRLHQAQKMEAVGQLTGGIAHDFNNMLQVMKSGLNLMERRIAQARVEELPRYIESMQHALDRSATLTQRLLAFSRRQSLHLQAIDPGSLVRGMEELIRGTVGPAIRLTLDLSGSAWAASSDPNQLETALLNLAINARDAMPNGGTLTITATDRYVAPAPGPGAECNSGEYVEIRVTDTGVGMTPETVARAFEPFFTTKAAGQGTGLGLSQVYGFIRQSGGCVRIDSAPGSGTAVSLFLPRAMGVEPVALRIGAAEPGVSPGAPGAATVLLVEDEAGIRARIAEALRDAGYTVIEAEDGLAGARIARSEQPLSLLITDIGLPGLNGRQLADVARETRPDLPVLLITGHAGGALDNAPLLPGMEVLYKPFALERLIERAGAMAGEADARGALAG